VSKGDRESAGQKKRYRAPFGPAINFCPAEGALMNKSKEALSAGQRLRVQGGLRDEFVLAAKRIAVC
jgi:hypothetical protein